MRIFCTHAFSVAIILKSKLCSYCFVDTIGNMSVTRLLAIQITSKSQVQKIRNFSKSFPFILCHIPCRNERTSIYEVRRKPFVNRGFPPNSLIFKFRRLFFYGCLRRSYRYIYSSQLGYNGQLLVNIQTSFQHNKTIYMVLLRFCLH